MKHPSSGPFVYMNRPTPSQLPIPPGRPFCAVNLGEYIHVVFTVLGHRWWAVVYHCCPLSGAWTETERAKVRTHLLREAMHAMP